MKRILQFRVEAGEEFDEAILWYEKQCPGLGLNLFDHVAEKIEMICEDPERFPAVAPGIRQALVSRFPYSILYSFDESAVIIYAVFHGSRDPGQWRSRIAKEDK